MSQSPAYRPSHVKLVDSPYLLFLGDVEELFNAKTAAGIFYWRPELCAGQFRFGEASVDLGLPNLSLQEAVERGVKTLVIGVAPGGGQLPERWLSYLVEGLSAGLDIANGLHTQLSTIPEIRRVAEKFDRKVIDLRYPHEDFPLGSGAKRGGQRLLTVGTDCAVGKMYTALAIEREMQARHMNVDFRATGQTGIMIEGDGVSVDAVVSDFVCGASEQLSPATSDDHWDIIEGQGSLFHPSYAGVSLGLLHGSQPDVIVLCHDLARSNHISVEGFPLPEIQECLDLNLALGRRTNPDIQCGGISLNSSSVSDADAIRYMRKLSQALSIPVVDPVRTGVAPIVDGLIGI